MSIQTNAQSRSVLKSQNAREHIKNLKEGVLLVRLHTKQKSIDALKASDRHTQAEQIEKKVREENLELVNAIKSSFSFCPVYFFYSHDSKFVAEGELEKVGFLNHKLEIDPSISLDSANYYTAEMGLIEQNTKRTVENIPTGQEDNPNYRHEPKYYGGSNMRFHAFIIKNDEFQQLERPFPYYSRTMNSFFLKKSTEEVIERMNQKLFKFLAG
ncbi:MAG: hypothetical protein HKN45_05990 [Flavobacteriales bacterium]|nr:hypothetical protein [Flavobacteriales bacterium]